MQLRYKNENRFAETVGYEDFEKDKDNAKGGWDTEQR